MVLFKDLNKGSTDVLTKDFPHDKTWDVEFKHSNKNPEFTQNAFVAASGGLDASSTVRYVIKDTTLEGKLGNTGAGHVDVKFGLDKFVRGLTVGAKNERRIGKTVADVFSISSEYYSPSFHGKAVVEPITASWAVNGVASYKRSDIGNLMIGGDVSGGMESSSIKYAVGAAYIGEDKGTDCRWTVSLKTAPQDGNAFGKLYGNVHVTTLNKPGNNAKDIVSNTTPGPAELAAEVQYSLIDQKTALSFGGKWYTDSTRNNFFKSKLNADGKVVVSMTHKMSDLMTATLGVQLDGMKASHPDTLKYGLKFKVTA